MEISSPERSGPLALPAVRERLSWRWMDLIPFAGLWLFPCFGLALHWETNPQYHFGYFVPLLVLYAGQCRWKTLPKPGAPVPGSVAVAVALSLALLPVWMVAQPNPDWPMLNWILTAQTVAITLAAFAAVGGVSWLRHFFMPAALIFTAVPWPDTFEAPFTQSMMRHVATCAVTLLDFIGVSAMQHGNLIEVANGVVGVDEACSGIRSLQGSLMASVVLGELFRFSVSRRVAMLAASLAIAFLTNVVRASFLAWSAAQSGIEAVGRWHDPAGMTILMICVSLILGLATLLDRNSPSPVVPASISPAKPLPRWLGPGLAVWLCLVLLATELWYHDGSTPPENPLSVHPPAESTVVEIPPIARAAFHSDSATAAQWKGQGGTRWLLYFFDWNFGPAFSRVTAGLHRPDICIPAGGGELVEDRGALSFQIAGSELPFRGYSFRDGPGLLFVYHGIWQSRSDRGLSHGPFAQRKRQAALQSVFWRERRVGQQSAEFLVWGCRDGAEADRAFREQLPRILISRTTSVR